MDQKSSPKARHASPESGRVFRALADSSRQRILQLLLTEELNVTELIEILKQPQSTISRHLKVLRAADLIVDRREGVTTFYRASAIQDDSANVSDVLVRWYQNCPLDASLKDRLMRVLRQRDGASGSFFERIGKRWDDLRTAAFGEVFATEAFLSLLPRHWTVADIGAGTGYLLPTLADNFSRVIAVDPAPTMLECARQRIDDHGAKNVSFHQGDLGRLPLETSTVDLAIAFLVLHHIPKPIEALTEIHRVLRPGGRLLLVEQMAHENQRFYETMQDHWWGFDPGDMARQVRDAHFEEVSHHGLTRQIRDSRAIESPGLFVVTGTKNEVSTASGR